MSTAGRTRLAVTVHLGPDDCRLRSFAGPRQPFVAVDLGGEVSVLSRDPDALAALAATAWEAQAVLISMLEAATGDAADDDAAEEDPADEDTTDLVIGTGSWVGSP